MTRAHHRQRSCGRNSPFAGTPVVPSARRNAIGRPAANADERVRELHVHVRLGGVPGVAALGDLLAGRDPVAGAPPHAPPAQMGHDGVPPGSDPDDHVVAEDGAGSSELAHGAEHHEQRDPDRTQPGAGVRLPSRVRTTSLSATATTGRPKR